ncbi:MAG: hypothetical protein QOE74_4158 [Mycobacterium sp.]|jgi:hypothetical protein|nr:hypothetical protein [Mycobacterium sp.]
MAIHQDSEFTAVVHFRGSAGADAGDQESTQRVALQHALP